MVLPLPSISHTSYFQQSNDDTCLAGSHFTGYILVTTPKIYFAGLYPRPNDAAYFAWSLLYVNMLATAHEGFGYYRGMLSSLLLVSSVYYSLRLPGDKIQAIYSLVRKLEQ